MKKIYVISQGKGGVGKTTISTILSSYLMLDESRKIRIIDTDGVNLTLSGYRALNAEEKNILGEDYQTADLKKIDTFFSDLLENDEDETIVIDLGASSFLPIRSHIFQNQIHEMLDITFILPICGGDSENTTMLGINDTLSDFGSDCSYLVVQNERDGKLRFSGSKLEKKLLELNEKYLGDITLPAISGILKDDYQVVTSKKLIFQEIEKSPDLKILSRKRLEIFYRNFFKQLESKGI
jgi:hypothetical protein